MLSAFLAFEASDRDVSCLLRFIAFTSLIDEVKGC